MQSPRDPKTHAPGPEQRAWSWEAERLFPDLDLDAKFIEDCVDARIEVPDRHSAAEPERPVRPSAVRTTSA